MRFKKRTFILYLILFILAILVWNPNLLSTVFLGYTKIGIVVVAIILYVDVIILSLIVLYRANPKQIESMLLKFNCKSILDFIKTFYV